MPQTASPKKFTPPALRARARAGDAFIANVTAAVAQIHANRPGAAAGRDPEHLHQLRVGVRRLRSTLQACRALLRRKETRRLNRRLRDALKALGAARDWDVFERDVGSPALRRLAGARAEPARRQARAAARSALMRFLPEEVLAWGRSRPWRARSRAGETIDSFSRRALERAYARLADAAEDVNWNDAPRRHRVRIRLKRLRYACECFAAAWPEEAQRPFLAKLRHLQDVLGERNDVAVQRRMLQHMADAGARRYLRRAPQRCSPRARQTSETALRLAPAAVSRIGACRKLLPPEDEYRARVARLGPGEFQPRIGPRQRPPVAADFAHQQPARVQVLPRFGEDPVCELQPVITCRKRQCRLVQVFLRQPAHGARGHVGRVAHNEVVLSFD
jgi:CHAD domain-containing protein